MAYTSKEEQYNDTKSSGFTFVFVGILGVVFLLLNIFGVINIHFAPKDNIMFYVVLGGLFIAFIIIGISSYLKVSRLRNEATQEENFSSSVIDSYIELNSSESIDSTIDPALSDEEKYFERIALIKESIRSDYENLDDSYADDLADRIFDKLYN